MGGQFWVGGWYWGVAYVSFFREVCKLRLVPQIEKAAEAYAETAQSACWWWPHRDFVMVCERPTEIHRDAAGRLHSETGAAIAWPDGWGVYVVHGTSVPSEWVTQRTNLDPKTALTWPNIEQRRAAAELIGWEKVLAHVNALVIDANANPQIGTLLQADLPDAPGEKFLKVQCATGRNFCLPVPKEMMTALQAQTWMWPTLTENDIIKMEVRT